MKRIIGGVTYNTATAAHLKGPLWQTRNGDYFLASVDPVTGASSLRPVTNVEARKHLGAPLYRDVGERTLTIRLPVQLHRRVASAADDAGQSINEYVMRNLERLLMEDGP